MIASFYILLTRIIQLFPDSPFTDMVAGIEPIEELGYVNYFLPVTEIIAMTVLWVSVVFIAKGVYLVYKFLYHKIVGD